MIIFKRRQSACVSIINIICTYTIYSRYDRFSFIMQSCHAQKQICTSTYTEREINNNESNINEASNGEVRNNYFAEVNVVYAKEMFSNYFVNDEQVQQESINLNISETNQEHVLLHDENYITEEWLLDSIRVPLSECLGINSAVEQFLKNNVNVCEPKDCTYNNEHSSVAVINENYITVDLTGFMKTFCSNCERDNSSCEQCQGKLTSLQCLKCNEKFHHRFWAIRHLDLCQSSSDKSNHSLKPRDFKCEVCKTKFRLLKQLRVHLQYCVKHYGSRHVDKHVNLEETLALVNYLKNPSQVLKETINKFGHQRFYGHCCTNCYKLIIDEVSIHPVECNNCKAMCLLQCHTCKCLHETYESIIDHLKNSFCGYQRQFFKDSSFQEQPTSNLVTAQQPKDSEKGGQTKKLKKIVPTVTVYCPYCRKTQMSNKKDLTNCNKCKSTLVFRCHECDIDIITLKALDLHRKLHLFKNYNSCSNCGRAFAQTKNLKIHEKLCAGNQTTGDDPIPKERGQTNIAIA